MPRFNQKLRAKMPDRDALPMLQRAFSHVPESCKWRVAVVDIDQRAGGCTFRVGRPLRQRHLSDCQNLLEVLMDET